MANLNHDIEMSAPEPTGDQTSTSKYKQIPYDPKRDDVKDVRNVLLVVAALISAATFAVGVNPPGGIWQDDTKDSEFPHYSGKSVLSTKRINVYTAFVFLNIGAFSLANMVIMNLVYKFPYYLEIWGAMVCMTATYGVSIAAVTPSRDHHFRRFLWVAFTVPYALRFGGAYVWKKFCAQKER